MVSRPIDCCAGKKLLIFSGFWQRPCGCSRSRTCIFCVFKRKCRNSFAKMCLKSEVGMLLRRTFVHKSLIFKLPCVDFFMRLICIYCARNSRDGAGGSISLCIKMTAEPEALYGSSSDSKINSSRADYWSFFRWCGSAMRLHLLKRLSYVYQWMKVKCW